jgi:hypothetical protein
MVMVLLRATLSGDYVEAKKVMKQIQEKVVCTMNMKDHNAQCDKKGNDIHFNKKLNATTSPECVNEGDEFVIQVGTLKINFNSTDLQTLSVEGEVNDVAACWLNDNVKIRGLMNTTMYQIRII